MNKPTSHYIADRMRESVQTSRAIRVSPYRNAMLFALAVFMMVFMLSSFYAKSVQDQNSNDFDGRLAQKLSVLQSHVDMSARGYEQLLLAASTLFSIKPDVTREEWGRFYQQIQREHNIPQLIGVGYATMVPSDQLELFVQGQRDAGAETFAVTSSQQGDMGVITYLAPDSEENHLALGYDMMSEQQRKEAMGRARDQATVVMTSPVTLVQDSKIEEAKGVLMYYPIYHTKQVPPTIEERRAELKGYVYVVTRPADLIKKFIDSHQDVFSQAAVSVTDITITSPSTLYAMTRSNGAVERRSTVEIDSRRWQLSVAERDSVSNASSPIVLFLLGTAVSLLLSGLTYWLFYGRMRRITTEYEGEVKRTKDELLALASHQLRTPASGVKQYLGILNAGIFGTLTPEQRSVTEKAYEANERQLQIINELLYVSKADAGQLVIEPKRFDLTNLTQALIDGFAEQAAQKNITITFVTKKSYLVTADDRYISMAIENLVSNAIKYSYPSSKVRVGIQSRGQMVSLYVKDSGVGIADVDYERIFDKFGRIDNPLSHAEGGSGLGLFLARQLARAHGGDIVVTSQIEKGSTFTMLLPKKLMINQTIVHLNRIRKIVKS